MCLPSSCFEKPGNILNTHTLVKGNNPTVLSAALAKDFSYEKTFLPSILV